MRHQRKTTQIAVAVVMPLIRPNRISDQLAIKRQCQWFGANADNLRRIPVRHHAIDGAPSHQERMWLNSTRYLVLDALQPVGLHLRGFRGMGRINGRACKSHSTSESSSRVTANSQSTGTLPNRTSSSSSKATTPAKSALAGRRIAPLAAKCAPHPAGNGRGIATFRPIHHPVGCAGVRVM